MIVLMLGFFLISMVWAALLPADPVRRHSCERQRLARLSLLSFAGVLLSLAATGLSSKVFIAVPLQIALCLTIVSWPLFFLLAMACWFAERPSAKEADESDNIGLNPVR